jgi:hypothetical protein
MHGTYRLWLWHFPSFNRYQHPFGHTSGASEIILTDPIYRLVAGEETSSWAKPSCDISPRSDILKNTEIRTQNPVLSNTMLAKMVPLSHLRRARSRQCPEDILVLSSVSQHATFSRKVFRLDGLSIILHLHRPYRVIICL